MRWQRMTSSNSPKRKAAQGVTPPAKRKPGSGKQRAKASASQKTKARGSGKAKPKPRQPHGPTQEARERASGLIDPNVGVVTKDPLRVQIVALATQRPIAPSEFAREAGIALNVASYHFRVLRNHGFLEIVEEVKVRGSTKHMHIATKSGFISDANWGQLEQALKPGVAGQALQDFNVRVGQAMEAGTIYLRSDMCLYWAPGDLDEIAWSEFVSVMAWTREEFKRLGIDTVERRAKGESQDSFPVTFAIAGFQSPTTGQIKEAKKKGRKRKATQADAELKCIERDELERQALSHPLRAKILALYEADKGRSLAAPDLLDDLADEKAAVPFVAYHVRVLRATGLLPKGE
jgi:DNA-binding transcriptional ArsR family regulator